MYQVPTTVTVTRDIVVGGGTVAAGSALTVATMDAMKNIQPLFANGTIVTQPDPYARRTRVGNPEPTYMAPVAYKALRAYLVAVEEASGGGGEG